MTFKVKCVYMWAVSTAVLIIANPAYAARGEGGIFRAIRILYRDHPTLAYILGGVAMLAVGFVIYSKMKSGKKIQEKEEKLRQYGTLMKDGKHAEAKALCKECWLDEWTGVYRGDSVRHNSKVLERLMQAIKASGQGVPPQLEQLAAAFKAQLAEGDKAKVDLLDNHDEVKAMIQKV